MENSKNDSIILVKYTFKKPYKTFKVGDNISIRCSRTGIALTRDDRNLRRSLLASGIVEGVSDKKKKKSVKKNKSEEKLTDHKNEEI